ncbi:ankyrin repeat domain-containing protein 31 [Pyxicephalus adspersus]|uniref:ankyrin repeat domain-containing protein 31 n=1 Tax=Pyxicephalus adspersus TaxID=30357 RepID=UPI003B594A4C
MCCGSDEFRISTSSFLSEMCPTSQHHCVESYTKALGNIHKRNFVGETKLHRAARRGEFALVTALIDAGIDVNQNDNAGWAAIHEASCKGYTEILLVLLEAGANVNSRGPDGILPIHDAVYGNHLKAAQFLLEFGADPYAKDDNHENSFDKCSDAKMAELLKSYSQRVKIRKDNCIAEPDSTQEAPINSTLALDKKKRENHSMKNISILQETESKQKLLLAAKLHSPEDADKYVEEMRHIQEVLNDIAKQQNYERDQLAKKYRASADSFKQGILRDSIAQIARRQKTLMQLVLNQKKVVLKITTYQQKKKSDSNGQNSSSQHCAKSPGRNPISGLLTDNEGHNASPANGSAMATKMPAVCEVPDSKCNQFQRMFIKYISSSEISATRDVSVGVLASERAGPYYSSMTLEDDSLVAENGLLDPYFRLTVTDTVDDHLETARPRNRSPSSNNVNSTKTITDKSKVNVDLFTYQETDKQHQNYDTSQPLESQYLEKPNQQADRPVTEGDVSENVRPQWNVLGHTSTSQEHRLNNHTDKIQTDTKLQIYVDSERKIRRVPMRKLISMGKLKPGKDTLSFQLQDYSHKATLLPDGRIRDHSGEVHRDVVFWVKAVLGNNISVSWKYVANKVTYCGKNLSSFMTQEDIAPINPPLLEHKKTLFSSLRSPAHTVLQVKDILLFDNSDFLPGHIVDQIWEEFHNSDL